MGRKKGHLDKKLGLSKETLRNLVGSGTTSMTNPLKGCPDKTGTCATYCGTCPVSACVACETMPLTECDCGPAGTLGGG